MDADVGWFFVEIQAQPVGPATPWTSPDILKALTELVRASGSTPKPDYWYSPEHIQAFASAIGAVAWPMTALALVMIFRRPILDFLSNVTDVEIGGAKFKRLQKELTEAGEEAPAKPSLLTDAEQARAATVATLLGGAPVLVAKEAEALAFEYDRVRSSRPPGGERTRRMEVVVAKMRTIGQAVFPLRHELAASPAPGKRLLAVVALQVMPDYEMLRWLAERPAVEKPFVGYHALIALLQAAGNPAARANRDALIQAVAIAERSRAEIEEDSDRANLLGEFEKAVEQLQAAVPASNPA